MWRGSWGGEHLVSFQTGLHLCLAFAGISLIPAVGGQGAWSLGVCLVASGELLNLSEPPFPPLKEGMIISQTPSGCRKNGL